MKNNNDIQSAITFIKPNDQDSRTIDSTIRYNSKGESDLGLKNKFSDRESVAIQTATSTGFSYKIKAERNGSLYDPQLKREFNYSLDALDRTTRNSRFQFREVNKRSFDFYLKYLLKGHSSLLTTAQRER